MPGAETGTTIEQKSNDHNLRMQCGLLSFKRLI
jgi:hypothetical protein